VNPRSGRINNKSVDFSKPHFDHLQDYTRKYEEKRKKIVQEVVSTECPFQPKLNVLPTKPRDENTE
jgi:hypothetical protein